MIANLPLLFSDGNPISLPAMSVDQIERFITFMVACSWGHDTAREIRKPAWWPHDVPFSHPFHRPPGRLPQDWKNRLRRLVQRCYDFHKSSFLLNFSAQLASYSRKRLRFVDNNDRTTSLVHQPTGKLLVTFRNENLIYDKDREQPSVPMATDIYLCDNCDDHFDSIDALNVHERLCTDQNQPTSPDEIPLDKFLGALGLKPINCSSNDVAETMALKIRRNNSRSASERTTPYPFSSLAGRKSVKTIQPQNLTAIRERIERYCNDSSIFRQSTKMPHFPTRYKRPIDFWTRYHRFTDQRNKEILDLKSQLLLVRCREFVIPLEKMPEMKTAYYLERLKKLHDEKQAAFISLTELLSQSKEDANQEDPLRVTEIIDLCSDEESEAEENRDPAQWQRVVHGGAVLRRTTSPVTIADDDNKRNIANLPVIRPTPVVLFSQSLSNLQGKIWPQVKSIAE